MKFQMSDSTYDFLNRIVKYILPAVGTLYFGLAQIWGFPYGEEVVGTVAVLATFFGIVLAISKKNYEPPVDGVLKLNTDPESEAEWNMDLQTPLETAKDKDTYVLKVDARG